MDIIEAGDQLSANEHASLIGGTDPAINAAGQSGSIATSIIQAPIHNVPDEMKIALALNIFEPILQKYQPELNNRNQIGPINIRPPKNKYVINTK